MTVYKIDPELKAELDKYLPPLPEEKFQKLKAKIAKDGYDEAKPIAIWEERPNTIVDGHHRYRACCELGIEPVVVEKSFKAIDDAVLYAIDGYLTGRELTNAQKVIAVEHAMSIEERIRLKTEAKENQVRKSVPTEGVVTKEVAQKIADKAGVGVTRVYEVHAVEKKGVPEVNEMIKSGALGVGDASKFVNIAPKTKQVEIVAGGPSAVRKYVRTIEADEARQRREAEEQRKFNEFNKVVAEKTAVANAKIDRVFSTNGDACLMPNMAQKWCNDCKWGFDIYLPAPKTPCCPYCKGSNLSKRDDDWNPREAI